MNTAVWKARCASCVAVLAGALGLPGARAADFLADPVPVPKRAAGLLAEYCFECHDELTEKGGINLDFVGIQWDSHEARGHWERVLNAMRDGSMPPKKADAQPTPEERESLASWLHEELMAHSPVGGTVIRRLSAKEYEQTVRAVFGIPFDLPNGFPPDRKAHGFDRVADSLVLSPALLEAYQEAAVTVADELFPPERTLLPAETWNIPGSEMTISYSSSKLIGDAMRIASRMPYVNRSCTWPSKFEAPQTATYQFTLETSAFRPTKSAPAVLEIRAKDAEAMAGPPLDTRLLHRVELDSEKPVTVTFEATLEKGEAPFFYFANAVLTDEKDAWESYLRDSFAEDPRLLAAWLAVDHGTDGRQLRGGDGWARVKEKYDDPNLDLTTADLESKATGKMLATMSSQAVGYAEAMVFRHFEQGPAIDLHHLEIRGPLELAEDSLWTARERRKERFYGKMMEEDSPAALRDTLRRVITLAYRRPAESETVERYAALVESRIDAGATRDEAFHLAIRASLLSPRFLYRGNEGAAFDDHDLASRLSYFLTNSIPDYPLKRDAVEGKLTEPGALAAHAERLLGDPRRVQSFVETFTNQWLHTDALPMIMPDARLNFAEPYRKSYESEAPRFFATLIDENRVLTDFIDPDFLWASPFVADRVYQQKGVLDPAKPAFLQDAVERISLERGGKFGGLLGMASIHMATANGVDTEPVHRGVWVLEAILGRPVPPPPEAVPALTPDTQGAKTVRDLLQLHTKEQSCAGCHRKIDPLGFALESFDAIGKWRDHYPIHTENDDGKPVTRAGARIDASGQLPDGTQIADVLDLKRWLGTHIDQFAFGFSKKLLTYATGRELSYRERNEIEQVVSRLVREKRLRTRDLILSLVETETFRTK